jgi:hypothetical protein
MKGHVNLLAVQLVATLALVSAAPIFESQFRVANATETRVPDYDVTPVSPEDVELYLSVLRATVDRLERPSGNVLQATNAEKRIRADKALCDEYRNRNNKEIRAVPPLDAEIFRTADGTRQFYSLDTTIAVERGVLSRYDAIKETVASTLGVSIEAWQDYPAFVAARHGLPARRHASFCGRGGDCGPTPTLAQLQIMERERSARTADAQLIGTRRTEILSLRQRFRDLLEPYFLRTPCG